MRSFRLVIFIFFGLALNSLAFAYEHPGGMHPKKQIAFVKKKIKLKAAPYYPAYQQLMAEADSALAAENHALADFNVPGFYRDALTHRANSKGLQTDAFNAYACALAYQLSGKKKYADKSVALLKAWAVKNKKYSDADGSLVMAYSGTALIMAAELLYHYQGWQAADKEQFMTWAKTVYRQAANEIRHHKNNWADWGRLGSILTAYLLDDNAEVAENIRLIKSDLFHKIAPDGHMPEEVKREANGIWYTYFSLAPITAASWVAYQADGTNLFTYQQEGRSIKKALDYMLDYSQRPEAWPWFKNPRPGSPGSWPGNLLEAMYPLYQDKQYYAYVKNARPLHYPVHHFAWSFPTLLPPMFNYDLNFAPD